ncbi:MAG: hypothetical protein NTY35_09305 [Planctomycetota bacterium]|nr:hypothetical protein [Planctomycetota bacterium]
MRKLLLFGWLLLPVAAGAYHFGPGQIALLADHASASAREAGSLASEARAIAARDGDEEARGTWAAAVEAYERALQELPTGHDAEGRALRLELAKARMFVSQLPEAHRDLVTLVEELQSEPAANSKMLSEARAALANAQYYRTWLMRLEGAPRDEWEPEIEASRQNYRLVAESAATQGDAEVARVTEQDLEAAVRLARMELSDLQGLPLPSQ